MSSKPDGSQGAPGLEDILDPEGWDLQGEASECRGDDLELSLFVNVFYSSRCEIEAGLFPRC